MPRYCCFYCPREDHQNHKLTDKCPECGRSYGFPLDTAPKEIRGFRIIKPLDRGFYAVIYRVAYGSLGTEYALKVSPKKVYEVFKRDFEKECKIHKDVAEGTDHVVKIYDMFDADVAFGDVVIPCYVAQIDFVRDARWLGSYLEKTPNVRANTIAQISIDLLSILAAFENKGVHHNDLHDRNILVQQLGETTKRGEAVDEYVRAIAVDLGSVSEASKSDTEASRLGDIHWIASHMRTMVDRLLARPESAEDVDYRLASILEERVHLLSPEATSLRTATADNWTEQWKDDIRRAWQVVKSPWGETFKLRHFNDWYNAQTLEPWFVPNLLVDPDGLWVARISTPGPQIISGMRGCGKTMLLRALQFHARAAARAGEKSADVLARVEADHYIGLYVSCTKLLDRLGKRSTKIQKPYERLFVAYAIEALRAVRHLQDIDRSKVNVGHHREIAEAVSNQLAGAEKLGEIGSSFELERALLRIHFALSRGERGYALKAHPSVVFPHLASAICRCSPLWGNFSVLFLFDDVSTRYLQEQPIRNLMSELLFPHPTCAFKVTTETQTLKLSLLTLAGTSPARGGRDYEVFDLGAEVNKRMKGRSKGSGKDFIGEILHLRAAEYANHPKGVPPSRILGDTTLDSIAEAVASTTATSRAKKSIYHGISALAGVCVGDIGDVISIYEMILRTAQGKPWPISPIVQSECFQRFCSRRLFDLNRKESHLKAFVLSFAEASHQLLVDSFKAKRKDGKQRLRQYLSIYVRVTAGNQERQFQRLRELIDAGIFVLEGGSDMPRTKTRDSNPIQQFKLTYRKLFGLSNFIGLSERDRFELSGKALEQWLREPSKGILLRNLEGPVPEEDIDSGAGDETAEPEGQMELFDEESRRIGGRPSNGTSSVLPELRTFIEHKMPKVVSVKAAQLSKMKFDVLVAGLGFEKRSLESVRRTLQANTPGSAMLIKYDEAGYTKQISGILKEHGLSLEVLNYQKLLKKPIPMPRANVLIDVTGLAKPVIFHAVRNALLQNGRVWICHTRARTYYPLHDDIEKVLDAERKLDSYDLLKALSGILTGEIGPYQIDELLRSETDESRRRVLCAFATPKHGRVLSLLDERDYDRIELVIPKAGTPRARMARIVADVAARNFPPSNMAEIDTNDLAEMVRFLVERFQYWYVELGYNFEIALTGSKLQAVASAAVCANAKVSHCWYLRPQQFDMKRFTKGVTDTHYFELSLS